MTKFKEKIFITGAAGFVGKNLLMDLSDEYEILPLVRKTSDVSEVKKYSSNLIVGDLRDSNSLIAGVKNADYIIHCAAVLRTNSIKMYYDVNVVGTRNLVNCIIAHNSNIKKIIHISTQSAMGPSNGLERKKVDSVPNPLTYYGKSKLLTEKEIERLKGITKFVILRPSAIYGPWDKDLFSFFKIAKLGIFPIWKSYLQLLFVKDLSKICKLLLKENIEDKTYCVAESTVYTPFEIARTFEKVFKKKLIKMSMPKSLLFIVSFTDELISLYKNKPALLNRQKLKEFLAKYWLCDVSDIKKDLKFEFTPLETGLKITYDWYRKQKWM